MHIKDFDPYDFSKKEIDGVPVYWKNLPWAPCVHIRIVFNVGAFNDPVGKEGLAHFLEHMMFDGCPSLPDKKAIDEFGKNYTLDSLNASTSDYWTMYRFKSLPEHFEKALDGIHDMIFHSFLRPEDVEHERKVIIQEAWGRYKNEKFLAYRKALGRNCFHGHQNERVIRPLGYPDTVSAIKQHDIVNFHAENYVRENMAIILAGNIDEKTLKFVETFLANTPNGKKAVVDYGSIGKPLENRWVKSADEIGETREQLEFSIERIGSKMSEKDTVTSQHASQLLGDLLHERLRIEHSLCYRVSAQWHHDKDYQMVSINVNTSEDKKDLVEKEIWNVINEISEGKHEKRFETIHRLRIDYFESQERLSTDVIDHAMSDLINSSKISTLHTWLDQEKAVTHEEVSDLIKKTFDPEYVFTEVILPSKKG